MITPDEYNLLVRACEERDVARAEAAQLREALEEAVRRIEEVLEDAALDDGFVSPMSLLRLNEHYEPLLLALAAPIPHVEADE